MEDLLTETDLDACEAFWQDEIEDAPANEADKKAAGINWEFHSEQYKAWVSQKRIKVIVAGRRWGKSEFVVRWMLTEARKDDMSGAGGVSWLILPTYQMSRPLWRKFQRLDPGWVTRWVGTERAPDYIEVGKHRIEFKSGDHPERLVGEGLRRVALDECGHIKRQVWTESIMPTLIDYGSPAMLTGTPKGKGWFYEMYARGMNPDDPEVETFGGPTTQNPFIKASEVERLRGEMPERLFRQEILAYFLDDEGAVFRGVRDCIVGYSNARTIAYGVDLARKKDYTVITGFDVNRNVTYWERFRNVPWPMVKERVIAASLHPRCGGLRPKVVVDATGVGDPVVQDLRQAGVRAEGFIFSQQSKAQLIDALIIAIEQKKIGLPDEPVILNEMEVFQFTESPTGAVRYSAPEGLHDDCVMSLALGLRGCFRTGDTGITIGEPDPSDGKTPWTKALDSQEAIFTCDPSSNDHLPAGWENPENWR